MATTFQRQTEPQTLVGLPPNTTLLEFGRWWIKGGPEVDAHLAFIQGLDPESGSPYIATIEAAIELAESSTDAASYLTDPVGWIERFVEFPEGESLTDYQAECLTTLATNHRLALRGPHGLGKAEATNTPIATPTGWTTIGELKRGDQVFDEFGRPTCVIATSERWWGDTYKVTFDDQSEAVVHANHEWNVIDTTNRPRGPRPRVNGKKVSTPSIVQDWRDWWKIAVTRSTKDLAETLLTTRGDRRWRVPCARPLVLPDADLPIDPYVLGIWLAEGDTNGSRLTLNRDDAPEIEAQIGDSHRVPSGERQNSVRASIPGLQTKLRSLGCLGYKHIPPSYLRASEEQRRRLLQGIMDGDGFQIGRSDGIDLCDKQLAYDVIELVRTLGVVAQCQESDAKINGRVVGRRWRINMRMDECPYTLRRYVEKWVPRGNQGCRVTQRMIVSIEPVREVETCCITVANPTGLYLTGPALIPTHNSSLAALAILWFSLTREAAGIDWKLPTTASAWRQITHFLWPEVHKWAGRIRWKELGRRPFTGNELQTLRIKLVYGEAWGQAAKDANSIEGAHATHLFYVFDEGKGIAAALWTAAEGAFSGAGSDTANEAWFLALSVPGAPAGPFFDIHTRKRGYENWKVRHVKKEEAIRAGRISAEWVDMMRRRFGEKSAIYQQRVEGNFAADATNSVIPLEWVEAAHERWHDLAMRGVDLGPIRAAGLDIAREGDDESVLSMSTWDCVLPLIRPQAPTSPMLVAKVKVELSKLPGRPLVVVDADGLGAGYYDIMVQGIDWQDRVFPFRAAAAATWKDHSGLLVLGNMRSAAWWSLRDELDPNRPDFTPTLALPDDELLTGDLTTPTYREGAGGRIYVEEKAEIKKRLGRSTDSGDSVVMCRVGLRFGARATVTAAQHKARPGTSSGDLRRGADAAGPDHGTWSPLKVSW